MKHLLLFNALIISGLSLNAQNYMNNQKAININDNVNTQQSLGNNPYVYINTNLQYQDNQMGGGSALQNFTNNNNKTTSQQNTTNNKPKTNVKVQTNISNVIDNNVGNVLTNVPIQTHINRNVMVNDVNENIIPQISTIKTKNKPVAVSGFNGIDSKPIVSSKNYKHGGKLKKGFKNIPLQSIPKKAGTKKTKSKRKPGFSKVKHHTSGCAKW